VPCHVWDLGRYRELSGSDSARAAAPANPVAFGRPLSALQGAFCGISNDCMEIDHLAGSLEKHEPANGPAGIAIMSRIAKALAFVVISLSLSGCGYNSIPTLQEQAKARWSDVQNQYQRRADLIPNLVATVQGYAAQEKTVLTAVVEARAKATQITVNASDLTDPDKLKAFQEAQAQLSSALGRLLAVTENYPDLKSNANFLALQSQLEGTENRIAVARRDYIDAVRAYNTALRTFPTVIWAKTAFSGEKPMAEFTANEGTQTPPQVKF
jgi:LemA protein